MIAEKIRIVLTNIFHSTPKNTTRFIGSSSIADCNLDIQ